MANRERSDSLNQHHVLILGASSTVGAAVTAELRERGISVSTAGRGDFDVSWDINDAKELDLSRYSAVIALAWVQKPRTRKTMEQNIRAYAALFNSARKSRTRVVFVSTMGAASTSKSWHVNAKKSVEKFSGLNDVVVRPGTFYDASTSSFVGSVAGIQSVNKGVAVSPWPRFLIPLISTDDLVSKLCNLATEDLLTGHINLFDGTLKLTFPQRSASRLIYLPSFVVHLLFAFASFLPLQKLREMKDQWAAISGLQPYLSSQEVVR